MPAAVTLLVWGSEKGYHGDGDEEDDEELGQHYCESDACEAVHFLNLGCN